MTIIFGVSGVTGAREVRPGNGYSNQLRTGGALRWILHFVQDDKPGAGYIGRSPGQFLAVILSAAKDPGGPSQADNRMDSSLRSE